MYGRLRLGSDVSYRRARRGKVKLIRRPKVDTRKEVRARREWCRSVRPPALPPSLSPSPAGSSTSHEQTMMNSRSLFIDWPTPALCFCSVDVRRCCACAHVIMLMTGREKRGEEWQRLSGVNPEEGAEEEERIRGRDEALNHPSGYRGVLIACWSLIQEFSPVFFLFFSLHLTWVEARTPPVQMISPLAAFFFTEALPGSTVRRKSWRRWVDFMCLKSNQPSPRWCIWLFACRRLVLKPLRLMRSALAYALSLSLFYYSRII